MAFGFNEWHKAQTGAASGQDWQTWSAAMFLYNTSRELTAIAEGGTQQVVWPTNTSEMLITGPAEIICTGEVDFV